MFKLRFSTDVLKTIVADSKKMVVSTFAQPPKTHGNEKRACSSFVCLADSKGDKFSKSIKIVRLSKWN